MKPTIIALLFSMIHAARADDCPMLGRDATRNSASPEKNPPTDWDVGTLDRKTGKWSDSWNIKWAAPLGSNTMGDPVVADGLVWVGTNNSGTPELETEGDASVLMCFRESDGKRLYRYVSPRLPAGREFDWESSSLACSPLIQGDRIWFTTNRGETVCMDIGPLKRGKGEPTIVWKVDMIKELGVHRRGADMAIARTCSPAAYKDFVYVITGNGVKGEGPVVPAPKAPSLVCFDKNSGKIVWQDNSPGKNLLYGQWSSPLVIEIDGQAQVITPQGDGWLRSFDALSGKLIWKFDMNFKTTKWIRGGRGTRNNILAAPVYYEGFIYIANGHHPSHGEGLGRLCCIDPTKRGDISTELAVDKDGNPLPHRRTQVVITENGEKVKPNPNKGLLWEYTRQDQNGNGKVEFEETIHRTVSSVSIKDGLLITVDYSGLVHCFDARTGKRHWAYDGYVPAFGSPLIAGDTVYIPDEDGGIAIFNLSADPRKAGKAGAEHLEPINGEDGNNMGSSVYTTPIFANGTLYVATRSHLFAIQADGKKTRTRP